MRNERERERRKPMSMGTRSARAGERRASGEVRPGAQAQWELSSPAPREGGGTEEGTRGRHRSTEGALPADGKLT